MRLIGAKRDRVGSEGAALSRGWSENLQMAEARALFWGKNQLNWGVSFPEHPHSSEGQLLALP